MRSAGRSMLVFVIALASGCHSSAPIPVPLRVPNGVTVAVTDAPGVFSTYDFATYQVDVTSLTVTDADGNVTQLLPAPTRVDFARYDGTAEFVSTATVLAGKYSGAVMTLDFSHADIRVNDYATRTVVPITTIEDGDGRPLTTVDVPVMLGGGVTAVSIGRSSAARLTMDFDLAASDAVDSSNSVLMVRPVVAADLAPQNPKFQRLRGVITAVDSGGFTVDMRPFATSLAAGGQSFGDFTVDVSDATAYDVDWQVYQGSGGLAQVAALQLPAPVTVMGTFNPVDGHIVATDVLAGAGMAPGNRDAVQGTVTQRQGDTLQLHDAVLTRAGGGPDFIGNATLLVDNTTAVTRQFDPSAHTVGDVSVGQHISAIGVVSNPAPSALTVDATNGNGWIRMEPTTVSGSIQARGNSDSDPFTFAVQNIEGSPVSFYDFTGTGADPQDDTDPQNYLVVPPVTRPTEPTYKVIPLGEPAILRGFVEPFGKAAGTADFYAPEVLNIPAQAAWAVISWGSPTPDDVQPGKGQALNVDLGGTGAFHHLFRGESSIDMAQPGNTLIVDPANIKEAGYYVVHSDRRGVHMYTGFDGLVTMLKDARQNHQGDTVRHIAARGVYDEVKGTLSADMLVLYTD